MNLCVLFLKVIMFLFYFILFFFLMPISRQMDKKAMVHIHNGMLLSH